MACTVPGSRLLQGQEHGLGRGRTGQVHGAAGYGLKGVQDGEIGCLAVDEGRLAHGLAALDAGRRAGPFDQIDSDAFGQVATARDWPETRSTSARTNAQP